MKVKISRQGEVCSEFEAEEVGLRLSDGSEYEISDERGWGGARQPKIVLLPQRSNSNGVVRGSKENTLKGKLEETYRTNNGNAD